MYDGRIQSTRDVGTPWGHVMCLGMMIVLAGICPQRLRATDHILTIGGGYQRSANQASLEANVLFFQELLTTKHTGQWVHEIYFADGTDPEDDLQIAMPPTETPAPLIELLSSLHRRGGPRVSYRNHEIPGISGPNDPALIRASLERLGAETKPGDRILIYVATHGSAAEGEDRYNTTIDGWNKQSFRSREFARWLEGLPPEVPVIMVMAQCYCGGFAHTIFKDASDSPELANQVRIGFFAQQHDLAAAGCRPDIENDEEFSSYFWGAMIGHSRAGAESLDCDLNSDGVVSFAEAYAHAVAASETIDIPLRATDVLLQNFSRLGTPLADDDRDDGSECGTDLLSMSDSVQNLLTHATIEERHIVTSLCQKLDLRLTDDVQDVLAASHRNRRGRRRGPPRRGPSGRRELLMEIGERYPELADRRQWRDSLVLQDDKQAEAFQAIEAMASYKTYEERRTQREEATDAAQKSELRQVKFRRLIQTLESIVRAANLPKVAAADVVERYRQMKKLEQEGLGRPVRDAE